MVRRQRNSGIISALMNEKKYVAEYNELKERNNREIVGYNEYFGISDANEKTPKLKKCKK